MKIKPFILTLALSAALPAGSLACSNIAVTGNGYAVTARTMDFPFNTGGKMGLGLKGQQNTSELNMSQPTAQKNALQWRTTHTFIGQTWLKEHMIVDGINDAGLYAAYLYLPDFTQYPTYNPQDAKKALNVLEAANYVLGTTSTVPEAVKALRNTQLVLGATKTSLQGGHLYLTAPVHLVIRDKEGRAAVIEWVHGKTRIYDHAGAVLTNSPTYNWQLKNAQQYDYVSSKNANLRYNGAYMNGSGFTGIPGDWSPPSRFARATQIVKHLPPLQSQNEAINFALSVIESIQVPLGTSSSPTLWKSVADLNHQRYYFSMMYLVKPEGSALGLKGTSVYSPALKYKWQTYDVNAIAADKALQKGLVSAQLQPAPHSDIKKLVNAINLKTKGSGSGSSGPVLSD